MYFIDLIITMLLDVVLVVLIALTDGLAEVLKFGDDFLSTYNDLLFSTGGSTGDGLYVTNGQSFFGSVTNLIGIMQVMGIFLLIGIFIINLIKSMFYNLNSQESIEHPMNILKRAFFYAAFIGVFPLLVTAVFKGAFAPLNEPVADLEISLRDKIEQIFEAGTIGTPTGSAWEVILQCIGDVFTQVVSALIKLIGMFVIVFHFFRLLLEVVERFLQLFFLTIFGPICIACGASPTLFEVSYKWFMTWLNSGILCIVNVFMSKLSLIAIYNFLNTYAELTNDGDFRTLFIRFFLTYATIRIGYTMDNYLAQMDVPILRAGGFENPIMRSKLIEAAVKPD